MAVEREWKYTLTPSQYQNLLKLRCGPMQQLLNLYWDTPDGTFQKKRWMVRTRRKGTHWLLTLKGPRRSEAARWDRIELERLLTRSERRQLAQHNTLTLPQFGEVTLTCIGKLDLRRIPLRIGGQIWELDRFSVARRWVYELEGEHAIPASKVHELNLKPSTLSKFEWVLAQKKKAPNAGPTLRSVRRLMLPRPKPQAALPERSRAGSRRKAGR